MGSAPATQALPSLSRIYLGNKDFGNFATTV